MDLSVSLPADVEAPRAVRKVLAAVAPFLPPHSFDDVRLAAHELVANAVLHGGMEGSGRVAVRTHASPERVRVEVVGGTRRFRPPPVDVRPDRMSGWGLVIVGSLANRWGIRARPLTTVWFEIDRERRTPMEPVPPDTPDPVVPL